MQNPFPVVEPNAKLDEISPLIKKENNAVLVKTYAGDFHIITKYDIIKAIS